MSLRKCMGCMRDYDDRYDVCPHCGYIHGSVTEKPYYMAPGSILNGKYIVGKVLGAGGFGITYMGWDFEMERKLAIKEYLPGEFATRSMPTEQHITVYGGEKTEQFNVGLVKTMDEAKRLAKFENVPNIVQIYDCFEANGTTYIVMEYLEGMSVRSYLKKNGQMPPQMALPVILQVAEAMKAVHGTGMLHRDIAPDNIQILNPEEEVLDVKLFDFGAARYATSGHSKSLSVILKPGYAPVEQYRSIAADQGPWTDVYALAATLYKMLTGVTPQDAMERNAKDMLKKPSQLGVKLSKATETALMNALRVNYKDRTPDMDSFISELQAADVVERKITKMKGAGTSVPKWVFGLAGAGLVAAIALAGLILSGVIAPNVGQVDSAIADSQVRVPNFVGKTENEAQTQVEEEKLDLGLNLDSKVYSLEIPADRISSQDIKGGSAVNTGTVIKLVISKGEETARIPDLTGMTKEEAEAELIKSGFSVFVWEEDATQGQYDTVIGSTPAAGEYLGLTKDVHIIISKNEATQKEMAEVPDVTGMLQDDAKAAMEEAGFTVRLTADKTSAEPHLTVLEQNVKAGEEAAKGSTIELRYSDWSVEYEDVELKDQDEARQILEALGLSVKTDSEYSDSVSSGRVIRVSARGNDKLSEHDELMRGDEVTLVVSMGSRPAKTAAATKTTTPDPEKAGANPAPANDAATPDPEKAGANPAPANDAAPPADNSAPKEESNQAQSQTPETEDLFQQAVKGKY